MNQQQIKALWNLLGQTWGNKFLEQYGPVPNEAWSSALEHVTADQAMRSLSEMIRDGSPFPPTLPEFIAMTVPGTGGREWNSSVAKSLIELGSDSGFRPPHPWETVRGYRTQLALHGITSFPSIGWTRGH